MKNPTRTDRYNIYQAIHKALRAFLCETLCRVGRIDVHDEADVTATLDQLDELLRTMSGHLQHENDFLHTAIDARAAGGARQTASDHEGHVEEIEALGRMSASLRAAPPDQRAALAFDLYHALALFVADNLQHMHVEETVNCATLWAHYSDAELHGIEGRLLATLGPAEHLAMARWMVPALPPVDRSMMLRGMQSMAPPEAFVGVLMHVRPHVDPTGWQKLAKALELGPALAAA